MQNVMSIVEMEVPEENHVAYHRALTSETCQTQMLTLNTDVVREGANGFNNYFLDQKLNSGRQNGI